ncbi:unnamed protein product [Bemisia tabaci]|uniref:L-xylulose reductase n=1 Tax=Bemisia tabaci TaxID=7038 RepID=A0A9P0EXZ0_BEMTA|nr:PREDICTED: L-xylulose reductase-like [Bemisia tabaci]CAH0380507.1 unnamed protein product [Bemisia tabaci]
MSCVAGKTILVTGAGQGIGKALCLKLADNGATVIALSRTQNHLDELVHENCNILPVQVDLSNWQETKQALTCINNIDGLVNNAGIALNAPLLQITEEQIDRSFNINVKALINVTQTVVPKMIEKKQGSIVNVSSQASLAGLAEHTVYCGTKAAVDGLTRAMALELGEHNIRVNTVNPTVVMTAMGKQVWSNPAKGNPLKEKIPLHRFAEVDDVVDAIIFLLSDGSKMITGTNLPIDGGYTAV